MNVLITGAAGFLGSHLMLHHLKKGDTVIGLDNYSSSERNSGHIEKIQKFKNQELVECDISRVGQAQMFGENSLWNVDGIPHKKFDIIYNFACPASPPKYQAIPVETMLTCVAGTHKILELARQHKAIFIQASTSEVYGDPQFTPQHESYRGQVNSYGPRACYDEGKRAAEALCYDYLNTKKVDARLVRIFNTYGPHMLPDDGRVVSNFICQALRGEPLTIYGDGEQTRSFCYVDDLIRGIVALGELERNPKTPINIGNPNEFSVGSLADKISKRLGAKIIKKPLPVDDPTQRCPDISKARSLLRWEPKVSLDEGLINTIDYFKATLAAKGETPSPKMLGFTTGW